MPLHSVTMKVVLVVVVALLMVAWHAEAEFMYNRILPKEAELEGLGLKCIPGRTVIRMEEKKVEKPKTNSDEDVNKMLRTHMNAVPSSSENCRICVCSVEGKDEYCSRRPARNVNECIRMSMLKAEQAKNVPYSHERTLAYRIRRDFIWHDDEIPYEATAKCRRGRSYYSNSITANDTDIDVASDVDSLLDYSNKDICFYCVCSMDGKKAGCIPREPIFCEYYRVIRYPDAARNEYRTIFKQDRPAYFRQLSYRLRRKMDEGMFDLMENGGDTLCCDHPDGHRRNLHEQVRNKIRMMRRKVPKENILSGSPGVGSGLKDSKCIPYISVYSDCTDDNACSGCTRCGCDANGKWECEKVIDCPGGEDVGLVDDIILDNAVDFLFEGLENKQRRPGSLVPSPPRPEEDLLLVPDKRPNLEDELRSLLWRNKRSAYEDKQNDTVKFYETVDELNEDTLKGLNSSGTIEAQKLHAREVGKISKRTEVLQHNNASANDLHIEYSKPHELEQHIAENKVDSKHPIEDKIDGISHDEIHKLLGNYSQMIKNKDLSKLVVNELSRGSERIGDKNVVPVSNITFTPENDTLTAMTFIAGNLLNKLWDMEKDANEGSYETEVMKHEKINNLLDLFKEPLSLRQEIFLKNALEKLSLVIGTNKNISNMSLCANLENPETIESDNKNCTEKPKTMNEHDAGMADIQINNPRFESKSRAIDKVNDVLNLMKRYEKLQRKLGSMKSISESNVKKSSVAIEENISLDDNISLNIFGNILDKITNLLAPNKEGINKRIKTHNMLRKDNIAKEKIEKLFNIKLPKTELGAKDRMITDYLSNVEKHPNCFFNHLKKPVVTPLSNIEGSILYNLSEFFKIKSLTDLLKVVNDTSDLHHIKHHNTSSRVNLTNPINTKQSKTISKLRTNTVTKNGTMNSAKEKLKNDIKIILQDILDLHKEHGMKTKSNINIADALPCIYKVLNADNDNTNDNSKNNVASTSIDKISSFIDSLKLDMKFMSPNRRSNIDNSPRPKSAIVWERTVNNLNKKYQKASRRSTGETQKTYKELREMMDKVELSGNTYKSFGLQSGVAPSERLILLKTLQADVKQYVLVLEAIKKSLSIVMDLPSDKQNELIEFIDNAAMNINLNKKLITLVTNIKVQRSGNMKPKGNTITNSNQRLIMIPRGVDTNENNNFKLRRDQIMTQLIMNRLRLYIRTKEGTGVDFNTNANYNIAKRILFHLENGNVALAKELYKVFLTNKQQPPTGELNKWTEYHEKEVTENNGKPESIIPKVLTSKEPFISDERANKIKMLTPDYFLKQLWNLKELKE